MCSRQENAFTTIELLAVGAILGIMVAFATPHLARWLSIVRLNASARTIATDLQVGRMNAISQNTRFRISFSPESNTYQMQRDQTGTWHNAGETKILPSGIDLVSATADPEFQTLGNTSGGSTITIGNTQGRLRTITVSSTGRVKVE